MLKLNIGSGPKAKHIDGYVNIDCNLDADIVLDLEKDLLPYADNSVDIIQASHVFEHIRNLIPLVNECRRVLKPGGILNVAVPCVPHIEAFSDPTHVRYFTDQTWAYWQRDHWLYKDVGKGYGIQPFTEVRQAPDGFQLLTQLVK